MIARDRRVTVVSTFRPDSRLRPRRVEATASSSRLGPTSWLIWDKVATAAHLGQILHSTDKRDEIERRIDGAPNYPLATNGLAKRDDGQHAAYPRHSTVEPPSDSTTGVLAQLFSNTHAL
jgi:hypothetical protein